MNVDLDPETVALLARLAVVRGIPCDSVFANAVLGASLHEIVPQAERIHTARLIATANRPVLDHG